MGLVARNLLTVGVDTLDKVPLPIQQTHSDKGQGQVTGGLAMVAGKDALPENRIVEMVPTFMPGQTIRDTLS